MFQEELRLAVPQSRICYQQFCRGKCYIGESCRFHPYDLPRTLDGRAICAKMPVFAQHAGVDATWRP